MSLTGLVCVAAGFVAGFVACLVAWGISDRRPGRVDQVRKHLADLGLARMAGLPEPTDAEAEAMIAAAVLAEHAVFAFPTLALGAALLRTRRRAEPPADFPVGNSPPDCG